MRKIDPTKTYVLTEAASGTTDLSKYQATYECKKNDLCCQQRRKTFGRFHQAA